jgi:predicted DNA repair protein MutK
MQGIVLAFVGIAITVAVYGAVGLIVKMDDIGLHLAQRRAAATQAIGRGLVLGMPILMKALGFIGTAAMLWVGGGIVVHGADEFHLTPIPHLLHEGAEAAGHAVPAVGGAITWLVNAAGAAVVGLVIGGLVILALKLIQKLRGKPANLTH